MSNSLSHQMQHQSPLQTHTKETSTRDSATPAPQKVQLRLQHCRMRAHALGGITDAEVFPVEAPEKPKWHETPAIVDSGDPRKVRL